MSNNMRDITFASVNLYNLQRPGEPMYPNSRLYDREQYDRKINWTGESLARLDADVISFQELWSADCLADAFAAAKAKGLPGDYDFEFIKEEGEPWDGIAVAAAVRKPWVIVEKQRHKAFPDEFVLRKRKKSMAEIQEAPSEADLDEDSEEQLLESHEDDEMLVTISEFSRSPLQITVGHERADDVPPIAAFCTHLKSKLPTRLDIEEWRDEAIRKHKNALGAAISTIRRTAEAAALRIILNSVMAETDRPTVLLGDLNDGQLSNTLAVLSGQPSFRLYADSRTARRNDLGLYNTTNLQQLRSLRDQLYTHEFKGVREVIDHVMVSEQFYDHATNRKWSFRELKVLNDHIGDDDKASSDHGTVAARFDWNPA